MSSRIKFIQQAKKTVVMVVRTLILTIEGLRRLKSVELKATIEPNPLQIGKETIHSDGL